jgi:Ciliary BBSome complex subunit 2, C-terminal
MLRLSVCVLCWACVHKRLSTQISELESVAEFPHEMAAFKTVLSSVAEYNSLRMKLTADMADSAQRVKALVIKVSITLLFVHSALLNESVAAVNIYHCSRSRAAACYSFDVELHIKLQARRIIRVCPFGTCVLAIYSHLRLHVTALINHRLLSMHILFTDAFLFLHLYMCHCLSRLKMPAC